jgi:threonine dehydrogenase-like Zn-dependent dehydrogenase
MTEKKEKSMVLVSPRTMQLQEFRIPEIGPGDVLLKVDLVSICGGDPIEYENRNVKTHYPIILGHELVGTVAEVGEQAARLYGVAANDKVTVEPYILCGHCEYCLSGYYQLCKNAQIYGVNMSSNVPPHLWGAYGEYMYVAPGSKVHKVALGVDDKASVLSSVLGNGVRWIRNKGQVKFGETVLVLGAGAQGLATIIAAHEANAGSIIVIGREKMGLKWDLAREYGATHLIDLEQVNDPLRQVEEITRGRLADVVVECTGNGLMMELGLDVVRPAGRYVMIGTCGYDRNPLTTDKVVFKEITIFGGLGQSWDTEPAVQIINSKKYALERMVTQVFPLDQANEAIRFFMANPDKALRVAIKP